MFNDQMGKYIQVMQHVLASSAVWLVIGISTFDNIWSIWSGQEQMEWFSWISLALIFYIGTGIFYSFAHGNFRVTASEAFRSAGPVIFPIILFSIKLSMFWMIPFVFALVAVVTTGENEFAIALVTIVVISLMLVSVIIGTAIVFIRDDYRLWQTVRIIFNDLGLLLYQTWLPMALCIAAIAISFVLALNKDTHAWLIIVTPMVELAEYAFFLYVVGVLTTEPRYLKLSESDENQNPLL